MKPSVSYASFMVAMVAMVAAVQGGSPSGEPECPCINTSSENYAVLLEELAAAGLPSKYGTSGCHAHDSASYYTVDCRTNSEPYCSSKWCYVDMTICPKDKERCEAAGGTLGSNVSAYCRTRPYTTLAHKPGTNRFWSYETCGYKDLYNNTRLFVPIADHVVRLQLLESQPWIFREGRSWTGPLYDFFIKSLEPFDPAPVLEHEEGKRREDGRDAYTACVDDVAIGSVDICVADLWVLPERHALVDFLPALRYDLFYLVVEKKLEDVSFITRLQRPFMPFTWQGWMVVLGFLAGFSVLLWLIQLSEQAEKVAARRDEQAVEAARRDRGNPARIRASRCAVFRELHCQKGPIHRLKTLNECGRAWYHVWGNFFGQSMLYEDDKAAPGYKLMSLGFVFFSLVTIATYTASLATLLIVEKKHVGEVDSIETAIKQNYKLCVPKVLQTSFKELYRNGEFVQCESIEDCPKQMHGGNCTGMILSQHVLDRLHAGEIKARDGKPDRDDCSFVRVGEVPLWSIPLGFPVTRSMAHGLSWAFTEGLADGQMGKLPVINSDCQASATKSDVAALGAWDLSGTVFITLIILGFAALRQVMQLCFAECVDEKLKKEDDQDENLEKGDQDEKSNADEEAPGTPLTQTFGNINSDPSHVGCNENRHCRTQDRATE